MFCVLFNTDKLELNLIRKKIPTRSIKKKKKKNYAQTNLWIYVKNNGFIGECECEREYIKNILKSSLLSPPLM